MRKFKIIIHAPFGKIESGILPAASEDEMENLISGIETIIKNGDDGFLTLKTDRGKFTVSAKLLRKSFVEFITDELILNA